MQVSATFTSFATSVALGLISIASLSSSVSAAPQILAVASTDLPIPINCEKGECSAELTAICLQEHRASPQAGHEYYIHGDKKLQLTLTTAKGVEIDLTNLPVTLKTARGHTALRVSLKELHIRDLDAKALHVSVPVRVTAIPMPKANDINPQTEADIYLATGPLRGIAHRFVDLNEGRANAARLVNHAINSLPPKGRSEPDTRIAAKSYFAGIVKKSGYSEEAVELAAKAVDQCFYETQVGFQSFRQCLGSSHDRLIGKLNTKYWHSLNTGS